MFKLSLIGPTNKMKAIMLFWVRKTAFINLVLGMLFRFKKKFGLISDFEGKYTVFRI